MIYPIIDNHTKKQKAVYGVINNTTRNINKMYAVVNGVTKLVWSAALDVLNGQYDLLLTRIEGRVTNAQYLNNMNMHSTDLIYVETRKEFVAMTYTGQLNNGNTGTSSTNRYLFDVSKYNTLYIKGSSIYDGTIEGQFYFKLYNNSSISPETRVNIPYKEADRDTGNINSCPIDMMIDVSSFNNLSLSVHAYFREYRDDLGDDWISSLKCTLSEFKFGNRPLATENKYLIKNGVDVSGLDLSFYNVTPVSGTSFSLKIYASYDDDDGEWDTDKRVEFKTKNSPFGANTTRINNSEQLYRKLNINYTITKIYGSITRDSYAHFSICSRESNVKKNNIASLDIREGNYTCSIDIGNFLIIGEIYFYIQYYDEYNFQLTINDMWLS